MPINVRFVWNICNMSMTNRKNRKAFCEEQIFISMFMHSDSITKQFLQTLIFVIISIAN